MALQFGLGLHQVADVIELLAENEKDVQMTPDYVKNKIKVRFVSSIDEVLAAALLVTT